MRKQIGQTKLVLCERRFAQLVVGWTTFWEMCDNKTDLVMDQERESSWIEWGDKEEGEELDGDEMR